MIYKANWIQVFQEVSWQSNGNNPQAHLRRIIWNWFDENTLFQTLKNIEFQLLKYDLYPHFSYLTSPNSNLKGLKSVM